jgi:hypothetical protein
LVDRLHRLDIDVGDDEVVGREVKVRSRLILIVLTEHCRANDLGAILVEGVEIARCNGGTNARRNRLARVTDEIRNLKQFCSFLCLCFVNYEMEK